MHSPNPKVGIAKTVLPLVSTVFAKNIIPFIKTNDTKNERIIVCFGGLKKSRILIAILDFLSPLKRTIIRAFCVISFYKWYNNGLVQFQHNLYQLKAGKENLLERIYFNASSLTVLREAMYASKYFHPQDGTFKLVFYPAMGQTEPEN